MSLKRNTTTPESKKLWEGVDRTAARVDAWPDWMKGVVPATTVQQIQTEAKPQVVRAEKAKAPLQKKAD